jgi:hypothetical protein
VQSSIVKRSNEKPNYKFFGHIILQLVGVVAYKLELLAGSQIHRVAHISLLKKALPANIVAQLDLSPQCAAMNME